MSYTYHQGKHIHKNEEIDMSKLTLIVLAALTLGLAGCDSGSRDKTSDTLQKAADQAKVKLQEAAEKVKSAVDEKRSEVAQDVAKPAEEKAKDAASSGP